MYHKRTKRQDTMTKQKIKTKFGNACIDSTGYYKITTQKEGNFAKHLHRLIYEEHYGKIPEGYIVHHKNCKSKSVELKNMLVSLKVDVETIKKYT